MARCPSCGNFEGVMLFTSVAPCESCYRKSKPPPPASAALYAERDAMVAAAPTPAATISGLPWGAVNPDVWHRFKHSEGWTLWTKDEAIDPFGFVEGSRVHWQGGGPVRTAALTTLKAKVFAIQRGDVATFRQQMIQDYLTRRRPFAPTLFFGYAYR